MLARALPVLAVLFAAVVTARANANPSLRDLLHRKRFGTVSTASVQPSSYGYDYGFESKEICLQELGQRTCSWISNCDDDTQDGLPQGTQPDCVTGQFWTSDFACCPPEQQHEYSQYGQDSMSSQLWARMGSISIGTCDWTIIYVDAGGPPSISSIVDRLGTAWATCYLGGAAELCGGPFCDRLVMSLEGTAYYAGSAYSYFGETNNRAGLCAAVGGNAGGGGANRKAARGVNGTEPARGVNTAPGAGARKPRQVVARRDAAVAADDDAVATANVQHDYYTETKLVTTVVKRDVYVGEATIIIGAITSLAGQRKERWEGGEFEYVPNFTLDQIVETGLDATYPWVKDKTYKLTFHRSTAETS